jgi:histidyl-tRNA synthetase
VAYQGEPAKMEAVRLAMQLRAAGVRSVMSFDDRSLKAQLKQAGREGVRFVLIIGEQELAAHQVAVKSMQEKGEQANVDLAKVVQTLVEWLAAPQGTPPPVLSSAPMH